MNDRLKDIIDVIEGKQRFLITSHVGPDGDSLGSTLALKLALDSLGKKGVIVIDDIIPQTFSFLPGIDNILEYEEGMELDFDLAFVLDSSDMRRIERVKNLIGDKSVVNIDHHGDNPSFGDYNLVEEAAATAQLIYDLIRDIEGVRLDQNISTALATGLITDTGSFRYSNTTSKTHKVMSELLKCDVDTAKISKEVFDTNSYENLILKGKAIEGLQFDRSIKTAWIKVSKTLLKEAGAELSDSGGLIDYPRSLKGVELAFILKEVEDDLVRISLRSNEYFRVDQLAHQFGGGGHPRAAGCRIDNTLEEAERLLLGAIRKMVGDTDERDS